MYSLLFVLFLCICVVCTCVIIYFITYGAVQLAFELYYFIEDFIQEHRK